MKLTLVLVTLLILLSVVGLVFYYPASGPRWTVEERQVLASLALSNLPEVPADPSNRYADNQEAAELGEKLFFDTRLSQNGKVACATCHQPALNFTDGLPRSRGIAQTARKSMSIVGAAYSPWLFWDGRKDSLWAQALGPLEDKNEHGIDRTRVAHLVARHYRGAYTRIFGPLPEASKLPRRAGPIADEDAWAAWSQMKGADKKAVTRVFVNIGKAIAAYERGVMPTASRLDRYLVALERNDKKAMGAALSATEVAGLRIFIGKANCEGCHSGPLLTNHDFHNTGVPSVTSPLDSGRKAGARAVAQDEFNCLSRYSDAKPGTCAELRYLKASGSELERAFKVPSLRNVARAAPYMHAGQFETLQQVLEHYNRAPIAPAGHSELEPLGLSEAELGQLEAFLQSLNSDRAPGGAKRPAEP